MTPDLQRSEIVGLVAGLGTTFAALPDVIRMTRRRSSRGLSPTMPAIMAAFQCVWVYYGLLIDSWPVVAWNAIAVLINSLCVAAYCVFARRERSQPVE